VLERGLPEPTDAQPTRTTDPRPSAAAPASPRTIEPAFDESVLLEVLDGDREAAAEIAADYLADAEAHVTALKQAVERGDHQELMRRAHTLKGASASVGAGAMRSAATQLEEAARSGVSDAALESLQSVELQLLGLRRIAEEKGALL
jgi:HPt (histidine-containing phosphotransfer) domain-containing protein